MSQDEVNQHITKAVVAGPIDGFTNVASFTLQHDGNNKFRLIMEGSPPVVIPTTTPGTEISLSASKTVRTGPDSLDPFFERLFPNIGVITTLGSSITSALVVSQLQDPENGVARHILFDLSTVRIFIAASWLIFTVTLVLSFFLLGLLKHRQKKPRHYESDGYWMVALLYFLVTGAFVCLSLAVAAYVEVVGMTGVAMLGMLLSLSVGLFCTSLFIRSPRMSVLETILMAPAFPL